MVPLGRRLLKHLTTNPCLLLPAIIKAYRFSTHPFDSPNPIADTNNGTFPANFCANVTKIKNLIRNIGFTCNKFATSLRRFSLPIPRFEIDAARKCKTFRTFRVVQSGKRNWCQISVRRKSIDIADRCGIFVNLLLHLKNYDRMQEPLRKNKRLLYQQIRIDVLSAEWFSRIGSEMIAFLFVFIVASCWISMENCLFCCPLTRGRVHVRALLQTSSLRRLYQVTAR